MKRLAAFAFLLAVLCCETLGICSSKLPQNIKNVEDPGLFASNQGEGNVLKVTVKDSDGILQQDARVIVDLGASGTQVKMTDASGEAIFSGIELKTVTSRKVERTEKTRKAGS